MYRIIPAVLLVLLAGSPAQARIFAGPGVDPETVRSAERQLRVSRAEPPMRPVGTTRGPRRAVEYLRALAEAHAPGYYQQCLRLADDAYMPWGPRLPDALSQWHRAEQAGVHHPKDPDPPVGAQMFWDPGHPSGHVATYIGDGKVVTNLDDGTVGLVKWQKMDEWGPYLGWAPPYYK